MTYNRSEDKQQGDRTMKVFYIRVSSEEQNEARQCVDAHANGAEKLFIEKVSGKDRNREELKRMLEFVREGDTVMVSDFSRIARNTKDLLNIIEELKEKGVNFVSLKENIDTNTPQGQFMLTVFGAMYQLEREQIRQRQAEGIAIAKEQKKYKGKQKTKIDETKMRAVCAEWRSGNITAVEAQKRMGMKPNTFYRRVKEMGL
jgi:DNA invertase Pin-like site-specific DNA recombinase